MYSNVVKKIMYLLIFVVIIILCLIFTNKYYKVEDRVHNIKKMKNSSEYQEPLAWLRVQGTNIDIPIMYYYDVDDITDVSYDIGWNRNDERKLAKRTIIYSHNVLNVSNKPLIGNKDHRRFEQLMAYIYYDFVKENKYIQYTIDGKNYLFKIYAVSLQKEDKLIDYKISNVKKYAENEIEKSYFKFDVSVNENDKLLTLITCTRFYGNKEYSFVVDARLVRNNELIKNYNVVETKKYKEVREILEGADQDEED